MQLKAQYGNDDIAKVYVLQLRDNESRFCIECVESVQPPISREEKWVLLVSTLYGCPIGCSMCDAGGYFFGKLTSREIWEQIEFMVKNRFGNLQPPIKRLKIQFARMGEPALNSAVLEVLKYLPQRLQVPQLMPSISTVAPKGRDGFFEELLQIKNDLYSNGLFQLQFSIHTTDRSCRQKVIPIHTWSLDQIERYANQWYQSGDRKITLNFAASNEFAIEPKVLADHLDPEKYLIKITPINPTERAQQAGLSSLIDINHEQEYALISAFENHGFTVLLSIGEVRENMIGSNCGQYISQWKQQLSQRDYKQLSGKKDLRVVAS